MVISDPLCIIENVLLARYVVVNISTPHEFWSLSNLTLLLRAPKVRRKEYG